MNPYDDMNNPELSGYTDRSSFKRPPRRAALLLIGIHRGQFREKTMLFAVEEAKLSDGKEMEIASAMTAVIPAYEISKLLDAKHFKAQREARDASPEREQEARELSQQIRAEEAPPILE